MSGPVRKKGATAQRSRVRADLRTNRLIIVLSGTIRKADLESIYIDIRFCVSDLQPGFDVITDMRNCTVGYLTGIATFLKIQNFLVEKKVGRIVRIAGAPNLILQQMRRLTKGYAPVYVRSMEEAEAHLTAAGAAGDDPKHR